MEATQDSGSVSSTTIDNSSFQQFQQNDISAAFPSVLDPSHPLSDPPMSADHAAHMSAHMSSMFHQPEMDQASTILSMQMSMGALSSPVDISAMDVSTSLTEQAQQPLSLLSDFPGQNSSFATATDHRMNGMDSHDPTAQLLASPSTTTASSNVSHVSSPALNGMASSYLIGSSSLASALDSMAAARSRSGSSASPGLLTSASSDLGFSSGGSGPPTSDASLVFPPGYEQRNSLTTTKEDSPESPGGAHLLVLGDMLKNIARTANSGSEACAMGPNPDARNLVDVVDVLKKRVYLLGELVAAMQLNGGEAPNSSSSVPTQNVHAAMGSNTAGIVAEPGQQLLNPPTFTAPPSETIPTLDSSDMSRKRWRTGYRPPLVRDVVVTSLLFRLSFFTHINHRGAALSTPVDTTISTHFASPKSLQDVAYLVESLARLSASESPSVAFTPPRHQHSMSGSSMLVGNSTHIGLNVAGPSTIPQYTSAQPVYSPTRAAHPAGPAAPHGTRLSRSSSFSNPFAFNAAVEHAAVSYEPIARSRPPTSGQFSTRPSSPDYDNDGDYDSDDGPDSSPPHGQHPSPGREEHGNESMEGIQSANSSQTTFGVDATDAKGEPIHQTLMAKKMQRLDESPDFRPFKFRIQAFTNAFLEELSRQGYPEEKIPMKKIRNFLWNQPYISRFNEEGKKSKSKGNHIWHVDAKKHQDGGWTFRPFQRRLAGAPPGVAYVGLRWSWAPRIWDPQASRSNMPVTYTAPSVPSWLSWKDDVLSGIPPPDAQNCDVTVEARVGLTMFAAHHVMSDSRFISQFVQDGQEEVLSHSVHISIAPMAAVDASFTPSRRPSLVGDIHNPRRVMSDTALPQTTPLRPLRSQSSMNHLSSGPVTAPDSQVVQVLTTAAQRVAQEAQSQVVASPMEQGHELQALAKQQHVLTVTAQAFKTSAGNDTPEGSAVQSNALAAAAQQVVLQAARQVASDRTVAAAASGNSPPTQQITVKEVSVATQSAVAQAVEMVGPLSSEVDVLMTAKSLLQQQTRSPPQAVDPSQMSAPLDPVRPHSTGGMLSYPNMQVPVASHPGFYAHAS
ncbi:hypothetical protein EUX98_g291 [Antrodiella citrinella]|uniref:Uncharacterized protein n=1 Tax=Antrodiella citrinella TaxID=2447956 RepID=A0A4S4N604_9APHY|nr:hypothetical protein EUX98_g291 [Antrodiella citrinella]